MKICSRCGVPKHVRYFGFRTNGRPRSWCKKCKREHDRRSYHTKPKQKESVRESNKEHIKRNKDFVRDHLMSHPCVDCGEADIVVLDFDHVRGEKVNNVANMVNQGHSLESLKEEIAKCEVRCANDHRRRTHERRKSLLPDSATGSTPLSESGSFGPNPNQATIL